jgi:hypothetical protein
MNAVITVFFVEVENGFGIAARGVTVTATFQIRADRSVIIDFAVEDNPNGSVLVRHWLVATAQIHNAQTPEPKSDGRVQVIAGIIGSAVNELLRHGLDVFA